MKLTVVICEDDINMCDYIKNEVLKICPDYLVDVCYNGEELVNKKVRYDIVFLDIEMPGRDGMSIAKELRDNNFEGHIIFLTSHTEFMPDAFKVKAFRFLQKPVDVKEMTETLIEAEKEIYVNKKAILSSSGIEYLVNLSEILYLKAEKNRTKIYTRYEVFETNFTLKYWWKEFEIFDFFQVHKSYIVSLRHIEKIDIDSLTLHGTETEIPVARRKISTIKKAFFDYIRANAKYI